LDLHYNRDIDNSFLKKFTLYFDVKNIFNRTYISSISVVSDSLIAGTPLQNPAAVLASSSSIIPGSPRAFYVGMKLKF